MAVTLSEGLFPFGKSNGFECAGDALETVTHIDLGKITEVIAHSGYESRLVGGEECLNDKISWEKFPKYLDEYEPSAEYGLVPIRAGNRIISPEELDTRIAKKFNLTCAGHTYNSKDKFNHGKKTWRDIKCPRKFEPCSLQELFIPLSLELERDELFHHRNMVMSMKQQVSLEVGEICKKYEVSHEFESGLLVCVNGTFEVFDIAMWMKSECYCACFNQNPMSIKYIAADGHRILIMEFDAESG